MFLGKLMPTECVTWLRMLILGQFCLMKRKRSVVFLKENSVQLYIIRYVKQTQSSSLVFYTSSGLRIRYTYLAILCYTIHDLYINVVVKFQLSLLFNGMPFFLRNDPASTPLFLFIPTSVQNPLHKNELISKIVDTQGQDGAARSYQKKCIFIIFTLYMRFVFLIF